MFKIKIIIVVLLLFGITQMVHLKASAQLKYFKNWPKGTSPMEVGTLLSQRFMATPHTNFGFTTPPSSITYSEVCAWYGALKFARTTGNKEMTAKLDERFRPLLYEKKNLQPRPDHVDPNIFGSLPLELHMQNKNQVYLDIGKWFADQQWTMPQKENATYRALLAKGLTWQTRIWIDDMYMITNIQSQAYRATGDKKYIERAAHEMAFYLDSIQRPNGLFHHAPDVPFFWGRGNGWMAAGMAELLTSLPKDNLNRPKILKGYQQMMASLKKYQTADGMWLQLLDVKESWPETSGSAMFAFAMITGVKNGWLNEEEYGPVARKAWLAIVEYIEPNGDVREVCQGTNKENSKQYYLDRKRITGDMHGQAPVLWCSFALLSK
ncbi:glycosyl hydrolase [Pedobacter frigiditerrae]|uniref:Glycosyl hydrolase n=1 Tax=Pedobacter frigiditerrae TaxID=2530452 RepID=A0A4R0MMH0_9SPHI|nr:glycoside hydrolase family 88 protein [Pedobacter frigiditerrae]TCC87931.1 glycosyl hydrolase [Pedobacter frigiditerrae]